MLDDIESQARGRWGELGHAGDSIELAREGVEIEVAASKPLANAGSDGAATAGTSAAAEVSTRG